MMNAKAKGGMQKSAPITFRLSPFALTHQCPCNSDKTVWGVELAVERTLVPAETRIWARVRLAVSAAKSASAIVLLAAVTFSNATFNEFIFVLSVSVWKAPRRPLITATWVIAASMTLLAAAALPEVSELLP